MKSPISIIAASFLVCYSAWAEDPAGRKTDPAASEASSVRVEQLSRLVDRIVTNRVFAPEFEMDALKAAPNEPILCVSEIVRAAIRALGKSISKLEITRLVKAAVETRPDAVLEIVRTAIEESRPQLHPPILSAAAASVPDLLIQVCVQHLQQTPCFDWARADHLSAEMGNAPARSFDQRKRSSVEDVLGYEEGNCTTLAEALVATAIGAGSAAGLDSLYASVNEVLFAGSQFRNNDLIPLPTPSPVSP